MHMLQLPMRCLVLWFIKAAVVGCLPAAGRCPAHCAETYCVYCTHSNPYKILKPPHLLQGRLAAAEGRASELEGQLALLTGAQQQLGARLAALEGDAAAAAAGVREVRTRQRRSGSRSGSSMWCITGAS
jgi:hypothetical protein